MTKKPSPNSLITITSHRRHRRRLLPYFRRPAAVHCGGLMEGFVAARETLVSRLKRVRWVSFFLGFLNLSVIFFAVFFLSSVLSSCSGAEKFPFAASSLIAIIRVVVMVGTAVAQHETAETVVTYMIDSVAVDAINGRERRLRYKRWLRWTRFGMVVTLLQFIGAIYLVFVIMGGLSHAGGSGTCFRGKDTAIGRWKQILVASFLLLVWLVAILQCFTGSDILRWRSFYATHDTAWKSHYREVFDHAIREALCCLGRVKYLTVLEEDEVYSVARLLGDLVAYRASGTGHLELLAGLALLQSQKKPLKSTNETVVAPFQLIQEASCLHQFAEAAYTGPLLDFGRNPIMFPCAWLYRQGVFTPWACNSRPSLEGDNWWRGHAAAFLKYVKLPPNALRRGRVSQINREAAYFVVVLHDQRSVVIAVRGTETPEDLITDGLGRECALTADDLDGLLNNEHLPSAVKQRILSTFPHYGHAGIIESARELFIQIDGQPAEGDLSTETYGFLSSLLGVGCECEGYEIRLVGHSLGGAIASVLGLRLYTRYPNLHVYAYGSLPCVDSVVAEACSSFVTTIVYNDEFSARLSVNSIIRLRAAAINVISDDSLADSALVHKLARRFLHINKYHENGQYHDISTPSFRPCNLTFTDHNLPYMRRHFNNTNLAVNGHKDKELLVEEHSIGDAADNEVLVSLCNENVNDNIQRVSIAESSMSNEPRQEGSVLVSDQMFQSLEDQSSQIEVTMEPPEMFLPGCIIHIVPEEENSLPFWKFWMVNKRQCFRAYVAKRDDFTDIAVTPYMFTDHLPWRCHYAMQRVLETQLLKAQGDADQTI